MSDLQVLLHTVSGGSLTAAARALGITPAAASATLKRLETQLGTRLFERYANGQFQEPESSS